jgi:hypothetical protein
MTSLFKIPLVTHPLFPPPLVFLTLAPAFYVINRDPSHTLYFLTTFPTQICTRHVYDQLTTVTSHIYNLYNILTFIT